MDFSQSVSLIQRARAGTTQWLANGQTFALRCLATRTRPDAGTGGTTKVRIGLGQCRYGAEREAPENKSTWHRVG